MSISNKKIMVVFIGLIALSITGFAISTVIKDDNSAVDENTTFSYPKELNIKDGTIQLHEVRDVEGSAKQAFYKFSSGDSEFFIGVLKRSLAEDNINIPDKDSLMSSQEVTKLVEDSLDSSRFVSYDIVNATFSKQDGTDNTYDLRYSYTATDTSNVENQWTYITVIDYDKEFLHEFSFVTAKFSDTDRLNLAYEILEKVKKEFGL